MKQLTLFEPNLKKHDRRKLKWKKEQQIARKHISAIKAMLKDKRGSN